MRRVVLEPRPDWTAKAEDIGFTYHTAGETPDNADGVYWYESAAYEFTAAEVDLIEAATAELHALCMDAVAWAAERPDIMHRFGIPAAYHDYIRRSWRRGDPHLMGRFDLAFDPVARTVKVLEYNADTPTLVIETALMQWFWLQDRFPAMDQFNSLHEKLLVGFESIARRLPPGAVMHFTALEGDPEENQHCRYFMDLAGQAGITTKFCSVEHIGRHPTLGFVDMENQPIRFLHKLYPWEWMAQEDFGRFMPEDRVGVVEPVWKMLLSNKALLPLLWEMFPRHPYLLAAGWTPESAGEAYIAKPILAREGANMTLVRPGQETVTTGGSYAGTPMVYQAVANLPRFDGQHVVIGSWIANGEPAGMILRESAGPIVVNTSRVVPHYFVPEAP